MVINSHSFTLKKVQLYLFNNFALPVKCPPFKGLLSVKRLLFGNHKEKSLSESNSLKSCKSHRIKLNLMITYGKCQNIKQRHQHFLFRIPLSSEI